MTEAVGNTDGSPDDGIRRMEAGTPYPRFVSGPVIPAAPKSSRQEPVGRWERLQALQEAFQPEDGQDGTDFDCAVYDAIVRLKEEWAS